MAFPGQVAYPRQQILAPPTVPGYPGGAVAMSNQPMPLQEQQSVVVQQGGSMPVNSALSLPDSDSTW